MLPVEEGNRLKRFPWVNVALIAVNCFVFFHLALSGGAGQREALRYAFTAAHPSLLTAVTSMFLHGGILHLLGNMYFLYVFGDHLEDRLGRAAYLGAYLLSGLGAVFLQYSVDPHSHIPLLGASGAISGVCALYMLMFPWQKMRWQFFFLVFPIFSVPSRAIFVVGLWFLEQYLFASFGGNAEAGGVAFWAHVGGFLTGVALFPFLAAPPAKRGKAVKGS
ncbi:MAG TPA: rhomboid family intramembrane serine protease [bacterium]|nr:rhomboid family intramembrane serine protease [bacterium]